MTAVGIWSVRAPVPPAIEAGKPLKPKKAPMSLMGQNAKYSMQVGVSDSQPNSDIVRCNGHFAFVPKAEVTVSFDHGVGSGKQRRWEFDAERFGSLEIDDQLKLSWLLNGHIDHFGASQQLRDLTSALAKHHA